MQRLVQNLYLNNLKKRLAEAKLEIKAIVMDLDGTIRGGRKPKYSDVDVVRLLQKISKTGKYPIIITASGASALRTFSLVTDLYALARIITPMYVGIGDGAALYKFAVNGRNQIYSHELSLDEEKSIIQVWQESYGSSGVKESDLQPKGIKKFNQLLRTDWIGYIPPEFILLGKQFGGQCFAEPIKVSVVFPAWDESRQRALVSNFQHALDKRFGGNTYVVTRGDDTFLHVTLSFKIDSKLFAMQTIIKELQLHRKNVVVFGDMPLDNDKGLLIDSRLPYTFTNHEYRKHNFNKPPYILPDSALSPVGSVYKAIDYLLS